MLKDHIAKLRRVDGEHFSYDKTGAPSEFIDFDGTRIVYTNSPVGLPIRMVGTHPGATTSTIELEYDGLRRLVRTSSASLSHTFRYDSMKNLIEESGADLIRFKYDIRGKQKIITYPDGRRDRFDFDCLGRPKSVTLETDGLLNHGHGFPLGTSLVKYKWAGNARLESRQTRGLDCKYEFDRAGRVIRIRNQNTAGRLVYEETSLRDPLGLRCGVSRSAPSEKTSEYRYDILGRTEVIREGLSAGTITSGASALSQSDMNAAISSLTTVPGDHEVDMTYSSDDMPSSRVERDDLFDQDIWDYHDA